MEIKIHDFQNYLEALARTHVLVQHGVDDRVAFVRFHSHDGMQSLLEKPGPNVVLVARYYGRRTGGYDEGRIRQFVQIRFASYAGGMHTENINGAIDTAMDIMFDFLAKMQAEAMDDDCSLVAALELEGASWDEIPDQPILDDHYGWDLTIPMKADQPGYDESRWVTDGGEEPEETVFSSEFSNEFE